MTQPLLDIRDLKTYFYTDDGIVRAVDGVSLSIVPQKTLGVVGESGCGKSITAFSTMRLIPSPPGKIENGQILFRKNPDSDPIDLTQLNPKGAQMRGIRGNDIAMIFQEPMTSLSPVHTVGNQIGEAIRLHQNADKTEARERAIDALNKVRLPRPDRQVDAYPHELSGGMRQRAMIAMALSCNPNLLIADEPTTALDVTVQSQILDLMRQLQSDIGMAIMLITHDLGVVASMADYVAVMYLGKIVEYSDTAPPFSKTRAIPIPRACSTPFRKWVTNAGSCPLRARFPIPLKFHRAVPLRRVARMPRASAAKHRNSSKSNRAIMSVAG